MKMVLPLVLLFLAQNPAIKPDRDNTHSKNEADSIGPAAIVVNCNESTGSKTDCDQKETPKADAAVQWSNWALVLIGGITAYAIWKQTQATAQAAQATQKSAEATERSVGKMDDANRISRENMQAGQRAYVSFPLLDIQTLGYEDINTGQAVRWEFRNAIENAGNTPACNIRDHMNACWEPGQAGLSKEFAFPDLGDEQVFASTLAAKAKFYSAKVTIDNTIIRGVREGKYRLYFYGWVTYRDVFEGTPLHRTEFCHEVRILEIVGTKLTLEINLHPQHNTQT